MRRLFPIHLALLCVLIGACVTINVYFPAAAAEKAADQFTKDVLGNIPDAAPKENDKTSLNLDVAPQRLLLAALGAVLEFVVPAAHAQADIDIATPEINAIKQSMTARTATLAKYFQSGAIGFTADGMIDVRDQNLIPLPERNTVRKLVADDNKDRATLYAEVAKANGHPEWEADLRSTFAERWVANAPAGWWHRDASGTWKQK
ncbi:MAG: YdbL family protein [Gammaproteobacteria bacterium]|nr:YdbL family protein [Gammaproteobacteria bacterium]